MPSPTGPFQSPETRRNNKGNNDNKPILIRRNEDFNDYIQTIKNI